MKLEWDKPGLHDKTRRILIKQAILDYTLPNEVRPGLKRKDIAKMVNRSESFVYYTHKELVKEGKLQTSDAGHILKNQPDRMINSFTEITKSDFYKIASIKRWVDLMKRNKVIHWRDILVNFWKVCKTIDVHPDAFLQPILEVEVLHDRFVKSFRDGKMHYINKKRPIDPLKQSQANPQDYTKSIKSFIKANGKEIPKGYLTIEENNDLIYARINLTDKERIIAINFMAQFGYTMKVLFILHLELGVRVKTLLTMKPIWERKYTTVNGKECEWFKCITYEKKQKSSFEKPIITPEARLIVKTLKNNEKIVNYINLQKTKAEYNQRLRELYAHLGKISKNPETQNQYEVGTQEWYYVHDSSHVLRHSCVHKLMRMTGYRSDVVASMFFEEPSTLKIYSKQTLDELMEQGRCDFCNRSGRAEKENEVFDKLQCALAFYNSMIST